MSDIDAAPLIDEIRTSTGPHFEGASTDGAPWGARPGATLEGRMSHLTTDLDADVAPIAELVRLIVEAWAPEAIWLFGSRARGTAGVESDWDLLAVVPDEVAERGATDPLAGWELARRASVRADVIACASSDFVDGAQVPNTLAYEAAHHGVLLYER
ncbi:MAG: nucleotidyltransferase domain-containing protein [Myxococcota bacterium]